MRTTLTLDPDVAALLKKAVASGNRTLKDVVNRALRAGLVSLDLSPRPRKRFVQRVGRGGEFLIDVSNNAELSARFDEEDFPDLHRREPDPLRDKS